MNTSMQIVTRIFCVTAMMVLMFASVARAQMPVSPIPQFMPASGWTVHPAMAGQLRGLENIKLPCMMAAQYDNGYVLRLSGGQGKFLAMALDYRQKAFRQGRKYDAVISLNNGYSRKIEATAFDENVLIFNIRPMGDLYGAMVNAGSMIVDVEGNPMEFLLGGFQQALQGLESCFGGAPPVSGPMPVGGIPGNVPPPPPVSGNTSAAPSMPSRPQWGDKVTPPPATTPAPAPQRNNLWEAKAGDDLKATLERWGAQAGVQVNWQATQGGKVADDLSIAGSFEDAVQTLMAHNAAAVGLDAMMMGGASTTAVGMPVPITPSMAPPPMSVSAPPSGGVTAPAAWHAPAGTSLRQVLDAWSRKEGVEFVWQANQGFGVKKTVHSNGRFEDAVTSLLQQYSNDTVHPTAQLNTDPATGRRTLFVQSTRI